jgi:hypothetical protein
MSLTLHVQEFKINGGTPVEQAARDKTAAKRKARIIREMQVMHRSMKAAFGWRNSQFCMHLHHCLYLNNVPAMLGYSCPTSKTQQCTDPTEIFHPCMLLILPLIIMGMIDACTLVAE